MNSPEANDSVPDDLTPDDRKAAFIDEFFVMNTETPTATPTSMIHRISRWIDANGEVIAFNRATGEAMRRTAQ